jgi:two-component system cell cycle sensor histidine kinase/response regulator CckA
MKKNRETYIMSEQLPIYNSRSIKTYLEYLNRYYTNIDTDSLLQYAGMTSYEVEDPGHWFTQEQIERFHEILDKKTGNPDISKEAGRYAATSTASGVLKKYTLGFMTPAVAYWAIEKIAPHLTRAITLKTRRIGPNKVEVTTIQNPGVTLRPFLCDNLMGQLEALSKVFTNQFAMIEHPSCIHRGDDCCRYIIAWEKTRSLFWKRIRNYSLLFSAISSVTLLFILPALPWFLVSWLFATLVLGLSLYNEHLKTSELTKTIETQGDTAKDLLDATTVRYNSAMLVQEIGQATSTILDSDTLISTVMSIIEQRLDFDRGMIMLANPEKTRLVYVAGYGFNEEHQGLAMSSEFHLDRPRAKGAFIRSFKEQKPFLLNSRDEIEKNLSKRSLEFAKKMGVHSLICVPIVYEKESIGILTVDNFSSKRLLTQSDVSLLMGVASQMAVSMVNAMSFKRLLESEERYRTILDNIEDGYFEVDTTGNFTFFNDSVCQMIGYSLSEMMGMNNREYMDEENAKKVFEVFSSVYNTARPTKGFDWEIIRKDGTRRQVDASVSPMRDNEANVVGFRGIVRDITGRKHSEEALRESEERYRIVFNNTGTATIIVEEDMIISTANAEFEKLSGRSKEEVEGKMLWTEFVFHEDLERMKDYHKRRREQGGKVPTEYEFRFVDTHGEIKDIFLRIGLIPGTKRSVASLLDITSRKQAERALKESEAKYRELVQNANSIIMRRNTQGNITFVNEFAQDFFGFTEDEILGRNVVGTIVPERDSSGKDLAAMIHDIGRYPEKYSTNENENMRRDGERVWVSWTNKAIRDKDGNVVEILCIGNDITERKHLESQLQQAQKMEAIGTLAGGIAHDFNNLLMGIQGHTSLMLMDTDPPHPHHEHLKGIEEFVQSASNLTRQLLGFAKGGKYEVKPTDLNELCNSSSDMFSRTKKEITIYKKYQDDIWAADVDQGQIEQVLLNLYVNAWQAMPGGGELYLETENVTLTKKFVRPYQVEPGRYVKISITDTGIGMDEKTQQRIFDPFFTTKEMGRGTGLGLASAYGIITNHGGIIKVSSRKGEGTTFTIYVPASEGEVVEEEGASEKILRGTETVLLVDDEEMILDIGRDLLNAMGYKVLTARSGREAVQLYKKGKDSFDLVILDMIMPDMGGGETFDLLKGINPGIKVLLSSGYSIDGQAAEIMSRGCDGFIQKPFNMKELSNKIRKVLRE